MSGVPARSPLGGEAGLLLLSLLVGLSAMAVSQRLGTQGLLVMLVLLPFLVVLAIVSLRFIQVPLLVWVVVLMGFRPMLFIPTPGLPDITLDRVVLRDNRAEHSGGGVLLAFGANLTATESEWSGNAAPEGKDVLVGGGCSALFRCCTLDPSTVAGGGPVTFDDTGCGVADVPFTWSALKQRYR